MVTCVIFRCTPGHYCLNGSKAEIPCLPGTYQDEFMQSSCKQCPSGFYCDSTIMNATKCSHGVQQPTPCPRGYFCPSGTKIGTQHGCPNGMISILILLEMKMIWSHLVNKIVTRMFMTMH